MRPPPSILLTASVPGLLFAHSGHPHYLMGVVSALDGSRIEVKEATGQCTSCDFCAETQCMRGTRVVPRTEVRLGERVVVETLERNGRKVALKVRLGKGQ